MSEAEAGGQLFLHTVLSLFFKSQLYGFLSSESPLFIVVTTINNGLSDMIFQYPKLAPEDT
jgi:hypothetical protein